MLVQWLASVISSISTQTSGLSRIHSIFWPGVVVTLIILSLTLMGTALENALNPRLRVSHLSRKHFRLARNLNTDREAVRG